MFHLVTRQTIYSRIVNCLVLVVLVISLSAGHVSSCEDHATGASVLSEPAGPDEEVESGHEDTPSATSIRLETLASSDHPPYFAARELVGAVGLVLGCRSGHLDKQVLELLDHPNVDAALRGAGTAINAGVAEIEDRLAKRWPESEVNILIVTLASGDVVGTSRQQVKTHSHRFTLNTEELRTMIQAHDGYGSDGLRAIAADRDWPRGLEGVETEPAGVPVAIHFKYLRIDRPGRSMRSPDVVRDIEKLYPGRGDLYIVYEVLNKKPAVDTEPLVVTIVTAKLAMRFQEGSWAVGETAFGFVGPSDNDDPQEVQRD